MVNHYCPVCGLYQEDPPADERGAPSHLICSCCGIEYGVDDDTVDDVKLYRKIWLEKGGKWWSHRLKQPSNWNREEQMKNIPKEFL